MRKKKRSFGEFISTCCFAGIGIFWCLYGFEYWMSEKKIEAILLFVCSICCLMGSLRFKISFIFEKLTNGRKK